MCWLCYGVLNGIFAFWSLFLDNHDIYINEWFLQNLHCVRQICPPQPYYNIASRAAQSNSVYVSVLQISTVLTDGVSTSLCQNFFRASSHCQRWEKYYISLDWWIQRLGPLVSKQTQFSGLFSWARIFTRGRKREKQQKRKLGISAVTIRLTVRKTLW